MRLLAAIILGLWLTASAFAGSVTLLGAGKAPAGGSAPFALDGTPQAANSGSSSALALPSFSTTYSGEVCVAFITNGAPGLAPTGGGLTFTNRASANDGNAAETVELWCAAAGSPVSGQVFTVNTTSAAFVTGVVFAFSGVKTSSPFDAGGPTTVNGAGSYATYTTTNANDIIITLGRTNGSVTASTGFTLITGSNFLGVQYQSVSATQSAVAWTWGTGGNGGGTITDAVQQGP
jgi:hypothetical protein